MSKVEKGVVVVVALVLVGVIAFALISRGDSEGGGAQCEQGPIETDSGLRYENLECGDGPTAENGDLVKVHYTLKLSDGSTFDSSEGRAPIEVRIGAGQVLPGFEEGLTGMRVGGHRRVIVPPELGYGARGAGEIPPNETLTFDLQLVEIVPL